MTGTAINVIIKISQKGENAISATTKKIPTADLTTEVSLSASIPIKEKKSMTPSIAAS